VYEGKLVLMGRGGALFLLFASRCRWRWHGDARVEFHTPKDEERKNDGYKKRCGTKRVFSGQSKGPVSCLVANNNIVPMVGFSSFFWTVCEFSWSWDGPGKIGGRIPYSYCVVS
jgi:hypothetical protein